MPDSTDWRERAFDLARGLAAYMGSGLIAGLAEVIAKHPEAEISIAFNHKQVASKLWARDKLYETFGGNFNKIWIVGGWYGVLAAMLFEDSRFQIGTIESFDIDPSVAAVARTVMGSIPGTFSAQTADMYTLDYAGGRPDLIVNTSCEHIDDLRAWLDLIPRETPVLLQSNDYAAERTHVSCMPSLEAFAEAARLSHLRYSGELPLKNYTRFMLIGRT